MMDDVTVDDDGDDILVSNIVAAYLLFIDRCLVFVFPEFSMFLCLFANVRNRYYLLLGY